MDLDAAPCYLYSLGKKCPDIFCAALHVDDIDVGR